MGLPESGRDPSLERTSVGFVLTVHAVREAVRDGMRAYKFLLGEEGYKGRFATADHGLESFVIPRDVRGRLGHFGGRADGACPEGRGGSRAGCAASGTPPTA